METMLFDYCLPREMIAQEPLENRDDSRLMVIDRLEGVIRHLRFGDLPSLLNPGDCLVLNTSRVFPGRIATRKALTGGSVELLLLESLPDCTWSAITRGAVVRAGTVLVVEEAGLSGEVTRVTGPGRVLVRFTAPGGPFGVTEQLRMAGQVPLPPYIHRVPRDPERYQTVYSQRENSAAAPTAGLHFTRQLMEEVEARGAGFARLELAVGTDTFLPVREEQAEDHPMHSEWFSLGAECAGRVNSCQGSVIAVGTTSARALESAAAGPVEASGSGAPGDYRVSPVSGRTSLYILPGYRFRVVDALLTNFHLPRSTLLMMVCAFGGYDLVMDAYREAVAEGYRFYSFGDAMLLTRQLPGSRAGQTGADQ